MKPTKVLPEGYKAAGDITLEKNKKLLLLLNLLAFPWFVICVIFFVGMASLLRSANAGSFQIAMTFWVLLLGLLGCVVLLGAVLVLHELTHGLFYWLFTRSRPKFGFKGVYAYTAMPGWYLSRSQFLMAGLAPLILLSLLGLAIFPFVPALVIPWLVVGLIMNATGAIGDLYIIARLIVAPAGVVIEDRGDGLSWYVPNVVLVKTV
jgi:hypothetical protein